MAVCEAGGGSSPDPETTRSWTSGLQDCEQKASVVYKSPTMGLCDSGQNGPGWWGTGSHKRPRAWHEGPCALQASAGSGERHFCPVPAGSAQGCPEMVTGAGSGARPLSAGLCVWCVPASCGCCNKVPQTGRLTRHDGLPVWCQKSEIEEPAGLARPGGPEGAPSGFCGSGGPSARGHVPLARASGERRRLTHVLSMAA